MEETLNQIKTLCRVRLASYQCRQNHHRKKSCWPIRQSKSVSARRPAETERKRLEEIRLKQEAEALSAAKEKAGVKPRRPVSPRSAPNRRRSAKLEAEKDEARRKEREIEQKRLDEERKLEEERIRRERQKREQEEERIRIAKKAEMERRKKEEADKAELEKKDAAAKVRGLTSYWKYEVIDESLVDRALMSPDGQDQFRDQERDA